MTIRNLMALCQDIVDDTTNELTLDSEILCSLDEEGIYHVLSLGIGHFASDQVALIELDIG